MKLIIILALITLLITFLFLFLDKKINKLPSDNNIRKWWEKHICKEDNEHK